MRRRLTAPICIFTLTMILTGVGILLVFSTGSVVAGSRVSRMRKQQLKVEKVYHPLTYDALYLKKQAVWFGFGLFLLVLFYSTDYTEITAKWKWFALLPILLVLLAYIPGLGHRVNGALRWIRIGPFTVQPSEFAKLVLVVVTAAMLAERQKVIRQFRRGFLPPVILALVAIGIIAKEDLGSAIVLAMIIGAIWFIAGIRLFHMMSLGPLVAGGVAFLCWLQPFRWERIKEWLWGGDAVKSWQPDQALIAVGTGGWTGLGLGMGIQKHYWVAAMHTDFIFADLCEEVGYLGGCGVLLILLALLLIGFRIAYRSPDFVGSLLAAGLTTMIAVPFLVNVAVVLRVLPTTGLALPFISYGGSSLVTNLAAIGILMNVAQKNEETQPARRRPVTVTLGGRLRSAFGRLAGT